MAGPGGQEVGRLKVRVLPDTSNFAQSLQRYLDRIEARSRLRINTTPSGERFQQDVRNMVNHASRFNQVRVGVNVDENGLTTVRQLNDRMNRLRTSSTDTSRSILSVAGALGRMSAMASAIPSVAALGASLASMAPAAAVATTGITAMVAAGAALKIGMAGVSDALSDSSASLEGLAPSAAKFVRAVRGIKDEWSQLQKTVQDRLFRNLAHQFTSMAKTVLPIVKNGLAGTATALNRMGQSVLQTAKHLGKSGALGTALHGANAGLSTMRRIPAQILNAFVKLAAAAAPVWVKLSAAMARGMDSITQKINAGFKSGGLRDAITAAAEQVKVLFSALKNVGTILGNIFGPAAAAGAGFAQTLNLILAKVAQLTSTQAFASTMTTLFQTLQQVGASLATVFGTALKAILPLISTIVGTLGPAIQRLVLQITPAISQVVAALGSALGPVVSVLASALASLAPIISRIVVMLAETLADRKSVV